MSNIVGTTEIINRTMYIYDDIQSSTIGPIISNLLAIQEQDIQGYLELSNYKPEPISLYITSRGGGLYDAFALYDVLRASLCPVHTYVLGYAYSAAFVILLAGDVRAATENSLGMIHQCWYDKRSEDYVETKRSQKNHDRDHKMMEDIIYSRTKLPKELFDKYIGSRADLYLTAKEMLKYKIINSIVKPLK